MEQAHPTGCLNSELRFERDKKPISEGREAPWGERSPPPSNLPEYTVPPAPSEYCTCGEGGGRGREYRGAQGQSRILGLANQKVYQNTFK